MALAREQEKSYSAGFVTAPRVKLVELALSTVLYKYRI
jgi:hypothetical protein